MKKQLVVPIKSDRDKNKLSKVACSGVVTLSQRLTEIDEKQAQETIERTEQVGTPFFTTNDLTNTKNILALLIRYLVIQENITREKFDILHEEMARVTYMPPTKKNWERHNTIKSLLSEKVTWDFVEKFCSVVGYDIQDVELTLARKRSEALDGQSVTDPVESLTIKLSDAVKIANQMDNVGITSVLQNEGLK